MITYVWVLDKVYATDTPAEIMAAKFAMRTARVRESILYVGDTSFGVLKAIPTFLDVGMAMCLGDIQDNPEDAVFGGASKWGRQDIEDMSGVYGLEYVESRDFEKIFLGYDLAVEQIPQPQAIGE